MTDSPAAVSRPGSGLITPVASSKTGHPTVAAISENRHHRPKTRPNTIIVGIMVGTPCCRFEHTRSCISEHPASPRPSTAGARSTTSRPRPVGGPKRRGGGRRFGQLGTLMSAVVARWMQRSDRSLRLVVYAMRIGCCGARSRARRVRLRARGTKRADVNCGSDSAIRHVGII